MNSKVYYGEYSISHWINLLISQNIVLPDYQRIFVWDKKNVIDLINSIKNNEFIPPITIGVFNDNGKNINYILDGQQRLTSILLSLFEVFPKKTDNVNDDLKLMNENDDSVEEEDKESIFLNWTFKELTKLGNSYNEIKSKIPKDLYDVFNLELSTGFYYNHYIGFSYIVPSVTDKKEQQKFYASIFRNINIKGSTLSSMESRESLYFLDNDKTQFFKPDLSEYKITNRTETTPIDFVRYMALLSQYKKDGRETNIARGYVNRKKIEDYYEEYIYSVVGEQNSDLFTPFYDIFPDNRYQEYIDKLKQIIKEIEFPNTFISIIDVDIYLFGLIYVVIIEKKELDISKKDSLKNDIQTMIENLKNDESHKRSPGSLKYLRIRILSSIRIYSQYVVNN